MSKTSLICFYIKCNCVLCMYVELNLMLKRLLNVKDFCQTCYLHGNKDVYLSENMWDKIEIAEIKLSLEPCYKATLKMQSQDLTLSDIYKIFNVCHLETAKIGSSLAQGLVNNLIKRRGMIMNNAMMLSSLYLDPRFSFELSDNER